MPQKIFIGNLSGNTEAYDIRVLFEKYGEVSECDVLKNYGFVHMSNEPHARLAITELDGTTVKGNRIRVELSTGTSKGGRGGFGGDRGRGRGRGGGGPMRGRGGGGGSRGRGGSDRYPSDSRPPPPPEYDPYYRRPAPYDYYDRPYGAERPRSDDRRPPPPPEDRYLRDRYHPYDRRPPPPDPYDRPYERPRAPPSDPYRRPPPDYYSRPRYAPEERAEAPPSLPPRGSDYYNGYQADYENGHESSSASAQSYYDRFYKTPPARPGYPKQAAKPGQQKDDDQSFLQTEPIFF
ncbi:RNA-binding protein 4.1-like isoform X3 [Mizuhopecten yessoensis]|uniref:RNA-binding protein 4.1-like isoform X3 n=1 Tax=Mizuhopecten yessoensis TaxID=6573 RepID=UPI000B45C40B|nr:RNA-binding protein 4.1-like isoform X3 [Mizuhopecten yessoensis]